MFHLKVNQEVDFSGRGSDIQVMYSHKMWKETPHNGLLGFLRKSQQTLSQRLFLMAMLLLSADTVLSCFQG